MFELPGGWPDPGGHGRGHTTEPMYDRLILKFRSPPESRLSIHGKNVHRATTFHATKDALAAVAPNCACRRVRAMGPSRTPCATGGRFPGGNQARRAPGEAVGARISASRGCERGVADWRGRRGTAVGASMTVPDAAAMVGPTGPTRPTGGSAEAPLDRDAQRAHPGQQRQLGEREPQARHPELGEQGARDPLGQRL